MHTPTHAKQLSRIFDRIVESECPVAVLYDRINDKFVTAKTNTPKWIEKFSGEMPPGLLLAGVYTHCIKIADLRDDMAATEDHSMEMRK